MDIEEFRRHRSRHALPLESLNNFETNNGDFDILPKEIFHHLLQYLTLSEVFLFFCTFLE